MKVKLVNIASLESTNFYISPVFFFLKSFYLKNGASRDRVEWLPQKVDMPSTSEFLDELVSEKPDVLGFSVYLWNAQKVEHLGPKIRALLPETKIIVGGPEINAQNEKDFFERYPWVDYVVYGDGEVAFKEIIDSLADPSYEPAFVNVITPEGGYKKYPHRVFKFKDYQPFSPWLDLQDDVRALVDYSTRTYGKKNTIINYERVRGCPYDCAFCNWSSGLHHKVNVRDVDWRTEVDFISQFGLTVKFTDANFGIIKEDVEVLDYALAKTRELRNGFTMYPRNFAKLNKQAVFEMMDKIAAENLYETELKVSLQNIDDTILENIMRPEIPWEEHRVLIKKLAEKYPEKDLFTELILGLPGSTLAQHKQQLLEFSDIPFKRARSYFWALLKNSPASKEEYRKKHNLVTLPSWMIWGDIKISYDEMVEKIKRMDIDHLPMAFETTVYWGELTLDELLQQKLFTTLYREVINRSKGMRQSKRELFETAMNELAPVIELRARLDAAVFNRCLKDNGFVLFAGRDFGGVSLYMDSNIRFLSDYVDDFLSHPRWR